MGGQGITLENITSKAIALLGFMSLLILMTPNLLTWFGELPPLNILVGRAEDVDFLAEGSSFLRTGNYTAAIELYDRALAADPNNILALTNKGIALARTNSTAGAMELYDRVLAIEPNYFKAILYKGVALAKSGDTAGAIEQYNKALALQPKRADVLVLKAKALTNMNNYSGAVELYDQALAIEPDNTIAIKGRAGFGDIYEDQPTVNVTIVRDAAFKGHRAYQTWIVSAWTYHVQIVAGQEVIWTNEDSQMHTVVSGYSPTDPEKGKMFASPVLSSGADFKHEFDIPGEFLYFCILHPQMEGKIVVS
jgi:tetratricopeptide (TPR) repeat protein